MTHTQPTYLVMVAAVVVVCAAIAGLSTGTAATVSVGANRGAPASAAQPTAIALSDLTPTASSTAPTTPAASASTSASAAPQPSTPTHTPSTKSATATSGSGAGQGGTTRPPIPVNTTPTSRVLVNWSIAGTGTLQSQSGNEACFNFPVNITDVHGGTITSFSLTVTWPMPPGQQGPATGSSDSVPVSIRDGQSHTTTVRVCLTPVPDVTIAGYSQMVASLTYYGQLANGVSSQFAGYENFTQ